MSDLFKYGNEEPIFKRKPASDPDDAAAPPAGTQKTGQPPQKAAETATAKTISVASCPAVASGPADAAGKKQFIKELVSGDNVEDLFAVKTKNPPRDYAKGVFFEITLADKTGEISLKYWGGANKERLVRLYESFSEGDVIQVRGGKVSDYREKLEVSVNEQSGGLRRCSPGEYVMSDFTNSLPQERIDQLMREAAELVGTIRDSALKLLLDDLFSDRKFAENYRNYPSAFRMHHNYIGGNLEHSVSVAKLCIRIMDNYKSASTTLDRDLVVAGALLHDIGKFSEYTYGIITETTDEGRLIGHLVSGEHFIADRIHRLRMAGGKIPESLDMRLRHIMLSHHGRHEWGSPKTPKIPEAVVIAYADNMDAKVKYAMQFVEENRDAEGGWGQIFDSEQGKKKPFWVGGTINDE
ncbi:MAG: hypothetical protein CVT48_01565 [Thermoplasmata archaeon HGW-Thermoplasmata-1]|nr:MAG: hypothetical protein CVT48_01565 [Thermoplasmata archaeon HGW-Thermoplasmata-1]